MLHPQVLDRNKTLIVVHGNHHIAKRWILVRLRACRHEYRIRRKWSTHVHALLAGCLDGRPDGVDFLAAETPSLSRMWIKARHCDDGLSPRRTDVFLLFQESMRNLDSLHDILNSNGLDRFAQADMDAVEHSLEFRIGQHHAHRHGFGRDIAVLCGQGLQHFRVPGMLHTCCSQRLLVHGGGDHARTFVPQYGLRRGNDGRRCHSSSLTLNPSKNRQGVHCFACLQYWNAASAQMMTAFPLGHRHRLRHPASKRRRKRLPANVHGSLHYLQVTGNAAMPHGCRILHPGFDDDFRSYAGRVAHAHGENRWS